MDRHLEEGVPLEEGAEAGEAVIIIPFLLVFGLLYKFTGGIFSGDGEEYLMLGEMVPQNEIINDVELKLNTYDRQ